MRWRWGSSPLVWRLWLRADFLLAKGDTTQVWGVPFWPVAFAMALGSVFLVTGVLLHLIDACRRVTDRQGPPPPAPVAQPFTE